VRRAPNSAQGTIGELCAGSHGNQACSFAPPLSGRFPTCAMDQRHRRKIVWQGGLASPFGRCGRSPPRCRSSPRAAKSKSVSAAAESLNACQAADALPASRLGGSGNCGTWVRIPPSPPRLSDRALPARCSRVRQGSDSARLPCHYPLADLFPGRGALTSGWTTVSGLHVAAEFRSPISSAMM
jgi:hypothetical protein